MMGREQRQNVLPGVPRVSATMEQYERLSVPSAEVRLAGQRVASSAHGSSATGRQTDLTALVAQTRPGRIGPTALTGVTASRAPADAPAHSPPSLRSLPARSTVA